MQPAGPTAKTPEIQQQSHMQTHKKEDLWIKLFLVLGRRLNSEVK